MRGNNNKSPKGFLHLVYLKAPRLSVNWYPNQYPLGNTWSRLIVSREFIDSYASIENYSTPDQLLTEMLIEYVWVSTKVSLKYRSSVNQELDQVSIKCPPRCWWSLDWLLFECRSRVNQEFWSRIMISTQLRIPLVHVSVFPFRGIQIYHAYHFINVLICSFLTMIYNE